MVTTTFMHAPMSLEKKKLHDAIEQGIRFSDGSDDEIRKVLAGIKKRIEQGDFGVSKENFFLDFSFKTFVDLPKDTVYSITYTFHW